MAQYWADTYLWESLLNSHPELKAIFELGTWMGGFSLFLKAQADIRGLRFFTYDAVKLNEVVGSHKLPEFTQLDIFAHSEEIGESLKAHEPLILFCDNGNKPREVKTFAPYLSSDSIIVVHDWMLEFFPTDIPDDLEEIYGDFCDEIGSVSRVLRKKV